jgi:hypothetical protein
MNPIAQRRAVKGQLNKQADIKMDKIPTTEDLLPSVDATGKSRFNRFSGNLQPDQMEVMDE